MKWANSFSIMAAVGAAVLPAVMASPPQQPPRPAPPPRPVGVLAPIDINIPRPIRGAGGNGGNVGNVGGTVGGRFGKREAQVNGHSYHENARCGCQDHCECNNECDFNLEPCECNQCSQPCEYNDCNQCVRIIGCFELVETCPVYKFPYGNQDCSSSCFQNGYNYGVHGQRDGQCHCMNSIEIPVQVPDCHCKEQPDKYFFLYEVQSQCPNFKTTTVTASPSTSSCIVASTSMVMTTSTSMVTSTTMTTSTSLVTTTTSLPPCLAAA